MRLSILANVYNAGRLLPRLFDSLLEQTIQSYELVIVDDGSVDDTAEVVRAYSGSFSDLKLISLPHCGLRGARNHGFRRVTGDICLVLDADETLPAPDTLERFLAPFSDPEVAGVGAIKLPSATGWVSDGLRVVRHSVYTARLKPDGTTEMVVGGAMALRVVAVNEVGGLTENPNIGEDVDVSWRLRDAGWKLIGRNDIVILHDDATDLAGLYRDGYKQGKRAIHNYLEHPEKLLFWKTWTRLFPLGTLALWPFSRRLALLILTLSSAVTFWTFRTSKSSASSKMKGWLVWMVNNLGWNAGFLAGIAGYLRRETLDN
jgi:glycosyltransferase involved in cell wall biosynthesis